MNAKNVEAIKIEVDSLPCDPTIIVALSPRIVLALVVELQVAFQDSPRPLPDGILALRMLGDDLIDKLPISGNFKQMMHAGWMRPTDFNNPI